MRYLSFLFLKMRSLRFFGLLGICLAIGLFSASNAQAQRVTFGVGIGVPAYYGPAPVCAYGYYDYYPYACAPYGFYGPDYFVGGVFIGAGPWFHGYGHGFYGRGGYGGYGRGGYYNQGRGGYYGRGGYSNQGRGGSFNGGYRGGYSGGASRGYNGGGSYRGGGNSRGSGGGSSFHGGGSGGSFHGGGGGSHGGGHGGGGRH
jgi:hypothetical protein